MRDLIAQADAKLKAFKAGAVARASAIQEANAQAAAQRAEDPPTPSGKPKSRNKVCNFIAQADAKLKAPKAGAVARASAIQEANA